VASGAETALQCGSHFKCQLLSVSESPFRSGYFLVPQGDSFGITRLFSGPRHPKSR